MPGKQPVVDVGVVTWNTRDLTLAALRRLLDSDQGVDLRLLVQDNASTDGTAEALRAALPGALVEVSPTNEGFAAGVNRLLARSESPWILLLNSDAWPQDKAIAELLACAERHPDAAVVAPRLVSPDGDLLESTHPFPGLPVAAASAVGLRGRWARDHLLPGAWQGDDERAVDWAIGAAWLLRRSAVDEIGGLDESFFMYAEDLEWCWRARQRGWRVWFDPEAVVVHVGNASGAQRFGENRDAAWVANTYAFYRREHGRVALIGLRGFNALGAAVQAVAAMRRHDVSAARYWRRHLRRHLWSA